MAPLKNGRKLNFKDGNGDVFLTVVNLCDLGKLSRENGFDRGVKIVPEETHRTVSCEVDVAGGKLIYRFIMELLFH